jgi:hypothetical protein
LEIEHLLLIKNQRGFVTLISRLKVNLKLVLNLFLKYTKTNNQQFDIKDRLFCSVPFEKLVVNCDGKVQCGSSILSPIIGDLNRQTILEIWNGKPILDIRTEILKGNSTYCGDCHIYNMKFDDMTSTNASKS